MPELKFHPLYAWLLIGAASVAVIALTVNVQLAFGVTILALLAWWAWQNPRAALPLLIVLMPLLPMLKITQTLGTLTLSKDVIILTLFARWVVQPLLRQSLPYRRLVLWGPVVALVGWTAVQTLRAASLPLGVLRARDIVLYLLLYFVAAYAPRRAEYWRTLVRWGLISFAVVLLLGAYQWYFAGDSAVLRFDPARSIWIPRVSATLAHPSVFGQYLITGLLLVAGMLVCGTARRYRGWLLAGGAAGLVMVYLTYSRAVWLGLVVALVTLGAAVLMRRSTHTIQRKHLALGSSILLITAVLLYAFTPVGTFVRTAFDPTYRSNEVRLEFVARLLSTTSNMEALFGQGLGNVTAQNLRETELTTFEITSGESRTVQLAKDSTLVDNQYLKTFIEMGLTGLMIYAWLYWRLLCGTWQLLRTKAAHTPEYLVGFWGLGFIAAFIVQAAFIDIWDIFPTNALFWLVAGIVSASLAPDPK